MLSKVQQWMVRRAQRTPSPVIRWLILALGLLFFEGVLPMAVIFAGFWLDVRLGLPMWPPSPVRIIAGMMIALAGFALMVSVIWWQYNEGQGTPSPIAPTQRLITQGPYAWVRNPMYVGGVVYFAGLILAVGTWMGWVLLALGVLLIVAEVIWIEEPELEARFGEAYRRYKQRVPRFIPRLKG